MLRLAFVLLTLVLRPLEAQERTMPHWVAQSSGTTAEFRALSVAGRGVVWAGGRGGVVARTTDGGRTWTSDTVPGATSLFITGIHAVDANTAYVLGTNFDGGAGKIFKTTDGGRRWVEQYSIARAGVFFDGLAFWDAMNGIAFSDPVDGTFFILTTSDGGKSWRQVPRDRIPPPLPGEAAFAASGRAIVTHGASTVWFATGGGPEARVFRSTDRGRSWTVAATPLRANATTGIFGLSFVTADTGFAVGGDYSKPTAEGDNVLVTHDGGRTWRIVGRSAPAGVRYGVSVVRHPPAGFSMVAVGPSGSGFSASGGATWVPMDSVPLNTVVLLDASTGWGAGRNGRIVRLAGGPLPSAREEPRPATRGRASERADLLKDPELAEQPPQNQEDEDGAEAPASELLRAVPGRQRAQELTHDSPLGCRSSSGRRPECRECTEQPRRRLAHDSGPGIEPGDGAADRRPRSVVRRRREHGECRAIPGRLPHSVGRPPVVPLRSSRVISFRHRTLGPRTRPAYDSISRSRLAAPGCTRNTVSVGATVGDAAAVGHPTT